MGNLTLLWKHSLLLVVIFHNTVFAKDGQFYGGSMSYTVEKLPDGKQEVTVEHITSWVLGKGPCGPGCSKADIGRSTRSTRPHMLISDPGYLGSYTFDYLNKTSGNVEIFTRDISTEFNQSYNESVIAVSEVGKWEQELLHFNFIMPNFTKELDINFDGYCWRTVGTIQTQAIRHGGVRWHIETKVSTRIRSDTGITNKSPKSIVKPFYRIQLGKITELRIPTIDADGDFIKCEIAEYRYAAYISVHKPPNVTVHDNCSVFIDASAYNHYTDNTWIAVPVIVEDYNREYITYGKDQYPAAWISLSTTSVQFLVQVLENLTTPSFVDPTLGGNHVFIMYADTTWRTDIYAEATKNTSIDNFAVIGLESERFWFTPIEQDKYRPRVKYSTLYWKPSAGDIGSHIACVDVFDTTGLDTAESRCFILEVKDDHFNFTMKGKPGKPYFVDIPSPTQFITCKEMATCVVPLYIRSTVPVMKVRVTSSYFDVVKLGPTALIMRNGEQLYQVDLSFQHSFHGKGSICFVATDRNELESEDVCIQGNIETSDPCVSAPCYNSGTCIGNKETGTFTCQCVPKYSGKTCLIKLDQCTPDPCVAEHSVACIGRLGILCYCKDGFRGSTCAEIVGDCSSHPCKNGSTCIEGNNTYTCNCRPGFTGTNCETDIDDCLINPCEPGGTCQNGINSYRCVCKHGYKGAYCELGYTLEEAVEVKCSATKWDISIDMDLVKALYPNVSSSDIYLGPRKCVGILNNSTLTFQYNTNECQTSKQTIGLTNVYSNTLLCARFDPAMPFVIRQHFWTFAVECDEITGNAGTSHLHHDTDAHHETFVYHPNVTVDLFRDRSFLHPLSGESMSVHIGEEVFVKVSTPIQDPNTKMRLHTCFTRPYRNTTTNMDVMLISDGCEVDAHTHVISQSTHETKFGFQYFEYMPNREGVDVYCNATFCDSRDYSTRCAQSCHNGPTLVG